MDTLSGILIVVGAVMFFGFIAVGLYQYGKGRRPPYRVLDNSLQEVESEEERNQEESRIGIWQGRVSGFATKSGALLITSMEQLRGRLRAGLGWAWDQGLILALALALSGLVVVGIVALKFDFSGEATLLSLIGFSILSGIWIGSGFEVAGQKPVHHAAIKTTFGRPTSLVRMGLIYRIRGFQGLWRVPTGQYYWQYMVEGITKNRWWVKVVLRVHFNWPTPSPDDPNADPDNETFSFTPRGSVVQQRGFSWEEAQQQDPSKWDKKSSFFLLRRAFYRFPKEPMQATAEDLQEFFRGATKGALLTVIGEMDLVDLVTEQEKMEAAVKVIALSEPGESYADCGIPADTVSFRVVRVELLSEGAKTTLEAEQRARHEALATQERAKGEGIAHETRMRHEKAAAGDEAARITSMVKAYQQAGVDPTTASILASAGVRGEELSLEKLMMLSIVKGQFGGKSIGPEELAASSKS